MTWPTEYLISHGWVPSPTTWTEEGAWEHFQLSGVPRVYGRSQGTYSDHEVRLPTQSALAIQLVIDSVVEEDLIERMSVLSVMVEASRRAAQLISYVGGGHRWR
jgi:hypothetical protein